jgi:hypothetical protein
MIRILVDHNIEGQATLLWQTFTSEGWLALTGFEMLMFPQVNLSPKSTDRVIWRFVQAHQMLLLTGNRNSKGWDSLGQTIQDENHSKALPILTLSDTDRLLRDHAYCVTCAERLVEVGLYLENYLGVGRLFIP